MTDKVVVDKTYLQALYTERPEAVDKFDELVNLLVESWDALAAVVRKEHLRIHGISPTLVQRIEVALKPWAQELREDKNENTSN